MIIDDNHLLRLHIEAVWDIQLPARLYDNVTILAEIKQPTWHLYVAQLANEQIYLWRSDVDSATREFFLAQAQKTLTNPEEIDKQNIEREVAFKFAASSRMDLVQAQALARSITPDDRAQVETFQPGSAEYFFAQQRAPLFGTMQDGRLLSIAHSSRRTSEACELGIETLPEARRKGYALAATILWTQQILQDGLVPIYSALAENRASLALAETAGYRLFARGMTITKNS